MKPENYARAILHIVQKGETPKEAVARVHKILLDCGRGMLMPHVARAFARLAAREARKNRNVLFVARKHDEKAARKAAGATEAEIAVDESLIGGWRHEKGDQLTDASWKNHLLLIYNNVTRT